MTVPPADTQEALDAKGLESSTTAFSQEQLAKLAFAIFYSANLCAPQNIAAVVKEIDTCGNDCEHVSGSHCQREERGDYCPFSLAEDLRQIGAALFGPRDPSHYVPSVFGPECMTAFRATTRAPGEGEPQGLAELVAPLIAAWEGFKQSDANMEQAYYRLAKHQWSNWEALASALAAPSYAQPAPCPKCAGTKFLDKGGARAAIQRTPCPDCAQPALADLDDDYAMRDADWSAPPAQPAPRADLVERLEPAKAIASATLANLELLQPHECRVSPDKLKTLCVAAIEAIAALSEAPRETEASPTSVLTITSVALSQTTDVLMAVYEWQAGSEILPIDLWTRVRDVLRRAGRT